MAEEKHSPPPEIKHNQGKILPSALIRTHLSFLPPSDLGHASSVNKNWKQIAEGKQDKLSLWGAFLDEKSEFKSLGKQASQERIHELSPRYFPKKVDDCLKILDCPDIHQDPKLLLTRYISPLAYLAFAVITHPQNITIATKFNEILAPLHLPYAKIPSSLLMGLAQESPTSIYCPQHLDSIYYFAKLHRSTSEHDIAYQKNAYTRILTRNPFHTDALYEFAHLIEQKSITVNNDNYIFKDLTDCDFVHLTNPPEEKALSSLPIQSNAAYIRCQNSLFYVDKANTKIEELKFDQEKFDDAFYPRTTAKTLTNSELEIIQKITHHRHTKNINDPIALSSFLYRRILQIDSTHPDALCRLAGQIERGEIPARLADFPELTSSEIPENRYVQAAHLYLKALSKHPHHIHALHALFILISDHQLNLKDLPDDLKKSTDESTLIEWERNFLNRAGAIDLNIFDKPVYKAWKEELDKISAYKPWIEPELETEYPTITTLIKNKNLPQQRKMYQAIRNHNSRFRVNDPINESILHEYCRIRMEHFDQHSLVLRRLLSIPKSKWPDKEQFIMEFVKPKNRSAIITAVEQATSEQYPTKKNFYYGFSFICSACLCAGIFGGYEYLELNNFPEWTLQLAMVGAIFGLGLALFVPGYSLYITWEKKNKAFQNDRILENINHFFHNDFLRENDRVLENINSQSQQ